ncbi:MarR family winged helix-turn-helix transcriptional regulator [Roseospirillum parvum]|uniref:DNA-binding transcriptional regulator, MarR family n=1 Tax=Roseospirillum parvum TaxID=83401 RepID=A0A1G7WTW2_9PROT|nr:MarR family transcriptional regulator [Roseospirillum parvum]SDG75368.1 DNA-binding transcriptional regulator, MarR family [Roseospirillum parvum]
MIDHAPADDRASAPPPEDSAEPADTPRDRENAVADDAALEVRLWLRLLTCTTLIEREIRTGLGRDFRSTLPRFDALAQLERAEARGETLSMGELSRRMMVSNGNVTGLVDRLVDEGLVERLAAPKDRRTQIVRLTPAGHSHFGKMAPVHHDWVRRMMAQVPRQDLARLHDLLGTLKRSAIEGADGA